MTGARGFTLFEVITTIVIAAIVMIPIAFVLIEYVRSTVYAETLTQTADLTGLEMATISNIDYGSLASQTFSNYAGAGFDLQRVVSYVSGTSNRLKSAAVKLFPHLGASPVSDMMTYEIGMDIGFGPGISGKQVSDPEASFFSAGPAGSIEKNRIQFIPVANTRSKYNITMVGVEMTSVPNNILTWIAMNAKSRHAAGSKTLLKSDPKFIPFYWNFYMPAGATFSGPIGGRFDFKDTGDVPYTVTVRYVFIDGSKSDTMTYSYPP